MIPDDIHKVAELHQLELDGLLSELGIEFLEKFYRCSLSIPEMWTIVEKRNDHILGFVSGVTNVNGLNKKIILKDLWGFIILFLKIFITQPRLIVKTVKTLTYPGFSHDGPELLTMVVDKKHQKEGIGRNLFKKATSEFRRRGIKSFRISAYDRLPANGFYKHIGCTLESSFMFLGEKMNYYQYKIKDQRSKIKNTNQK